MRAKTNRSTPTRWLAAGAVASLAILPSPSWSQGTGDSVVIPAKDVAGTQIGSIDWTTQVVTADGSGVPPAGTTESQGRLMACEAASIVAKKNLLETVKGLQIDSTATVHNLVLQKQDISARVEGLIQATKVDQKREADGTCTVTVRLGIFGTPGKSSVASALGDPNGWRIAPPPAPVTPPTTPPSAPPATPGENPPAVTPVTTPPTPPAPVNPGEVFTGLVVDARGLAAKPAMVPKILDESGEQLYGSADVTRDYVIQYGLAGYTKNLKAASENTRVTDKPMVLKAIRADGAQKADMVLSNADGARLREAGKNQSFLAKARVMIVLD